MGQSLFVLRTDRGNLRAYFGGTNVDNLQATAQRSPLIEFDQELERIAGLHEQAALNFDAGLTDIQDFAGR